MRYQIRHEELGLFHGHLMGRDFWENLGPVPEAGAKIYTDEETARAEIASMVEAYCKNDPVKFAPSTFYVEPFDQEYDEKSIRSAIKVRRPNEFYCAVALYNEDSTVKGLKKYPAPDLLCWIILASKYHPELKKNSRFN